MYDWFHALLKKIDYNRFVALGVLIAIAVVGIIFNGCESTVASLVTPGQSVTRLELAGEDIGFRAAFEKRKAELDAGYTALAVDVAAHEELKALHVEILDRKDEWKAMLFDFFSVTMTDLQAGTYNPAGLVVFGLGVIGSIFGVSAYKDKRRTDNELAERKAGDSA